MKDLLFAVGTRPNLIKLKPLVDAAEQRGLSFDIYDTFQHYDPDMREVFYKEFSLTSSNYFPTKAKPTADYKAVVVIGDTNSTVECALLAARMGLRVAHVEAGCRCGKNIPEEINRKAVDSIATWNFAPTETAFYNLLAPGTYFTGDVLYDMFLRWAPTYRPIPRLALATIHRQENSEPSRVWKLLDEINSEFEIILFPVHPRLHFIDSFPARVFPLRPLNYASTQFLLSRVSHVFTDSGGLQREAYWMGVPLTLLRDETEWPETLVPGNKNAFGDGHAADDIMSILVETI